MVKTYDKKKDANKQLSKNFKLSEFDCKCNRCSKVLLDTKLVDNLQKIRDHFNASVNVNSGYRCKTHNKEVNGSSSSHHMKGMAADIRVEGVDPKDVAKYAESIGIKRIGLYDGAAEGNFVHIGSGTTKKFWLGHGQKKIDTFGGTVKKITLELPVLEKGAKGGAVWALQAMLKGLGYERIDEDTVLEVDGSFGGVTEKLLKKFQHEYDLEGDGKCGKATWTSLLNL
jgi:hypothetical protein